VFAAYRSIVFGLCLINGGAFCSVMKPALFMEKQHRCLLKVKSNRYFIRLLVLETKVGKKGEGVSWFIYDERPNVEIRAFLS